MRVRWSKCTKLCGGGYRYRNRTVVKPAVNGGTGCPGLSQVEKCNAWACPKMDCVLGSFLPWTKCTKSCGTGGTQTRKRPIVRPAMGGGSCEPTQTRECNVKPCPVDCVVSNYSAWSLCSVKCGGGTRSRTRKIVTAQANGGSLCPSLVQSEDCNTKPCAPLQCTMSAWGNWTACSKVKLLREVSAAFSLSFRLLLGHRRENKISCA